MKLSKTNRTFCQPFFLFEGKHLYSMQKRKRENKRNLVNSWEITEKMGGLNFDHADEQNYANRREITGEICFSSPLFHVRIFIFTDSSIIQLLACNIMSFEFCLFI